MKKKILLVIDEEKREIEADYFDLSLSTGIGKGYDLILAITSAIEGEQQILEPIHGGVLHPISNAISADLPSTLDFSAIGLKENLVALRTAFGVSFQEGEGGRTLTERAVYISETYDISLPDIFKIVFEHLVAWEKKTIEARPAKVVREPTVVFKNTDRTKFQVEETILLQKGNVEVDSMTEEVI